MKKCPSEIELKAYMAADQEAAADEDLAQHLAECDQCRTRVESHKKSHSNSSRSELSLSVGHTFLQRLKKLPKSVSSEKPRPILSEGTELDDFVVQQQIDSGGMGVIYLALQKTVDRTVALKTIIPAATNEFMLERFERERKFLARLHHSNVVPLHYSGTVDDIEYFAMPFIDGIRINQLAPRLRNANSFPALDEIEIDAPSAVQNGWSPTQDYFRVVAGIVRDLANTIHSVHEAGIVHRDVTPNNVLLDRDNHAWLIDFGIAADIGKDQEFVDSPGLYDVSVESGIGTPKYKAPELSENKAGRQSDVYGLGVCMFCLLTGQDFSNSDYSDSNRPELKQLVDQIPRPLEAVCQRALQFHPENRFQTADELEQDLNRWLNHEPVSSKNYTAAERMILWLKRNPAKAITTAATIALLILGTVFTGIAYSFSAQAKQFQVEAANEQYEADLYKFNSLFEQGEIKEAFAFLGEADLLSQAPASQRFEIQLRKLKLLIWLGDRQTANRSIAEIRASTKDPKSISRLKLVQAEAELELDVHATKRIADEIPRKHLNETEKLFADALGAVKTLDEQRYLRELIAREPYQLRAQQMLVFNHLFLGQKQLVYEQLHRARAIFPDDLSLGIAEMTILWLDNDLDGANQRFDLLNQKNKSSLTRTVLQQAKSFLPNPDNITSTDNNVKLEEANRFLAGNYTLARTRDKPGGILILPPTLNRALDTIKETQRKFADRQYRKRHIEKMEKFLQIHPENVFEMSLARDLMANSEFTKLGERLESTLENETIYSMFNFDSNIVTQLTLTRCTLFLGELKQLGKDSVKHETIENLKQSLGRFLAEGRFPGDDWQDGLGSRTTIVDCAYLIGEMELAHRLALKWVREYPDEAEAYAYAGLTAYHNDNHFSAVGWFRQAVEKGVGEMAFKQRYRQSLEYVQANLPKHVEEFETIKDSLPDKNDDE